MWAGILGLVEETAFTSLEDLQVISNYKYIKHKIQEKATLRNRPESAHTSGTLKKIFYILYYICRENDKYLNEIHYRMEY